MTARLNEIWSSTEGCAGTKVNSFPTASCLSPVPRRSSSPPEQCRRRQWLCWRAFPGGPPRGRALHPPTALAMQRSLRPCAGSPTPAWPAGLPGHQHLHRLPGGHSHLICTSWLSQVERALE